MSDFIIFIICLIIIALRFYFEFIYTERYGSRYGSWRLRYAYDPLERVRDEYEGRLRRYYSNNQPRVYLKNDNCELRLITDGSGTHFYCKEKTNGKRKGRFFEVTGNNEHNNAHVSTMWGILDMEFNRSSTYSSMRRLYMSLNKTGNSTGGLRYFYEPLFKKYPYYNGVYAQNEYCRMELRYLENSQSIILCTDVWDKNQKQFIIIGNRYLLVNIISEFEKEDDKFVTFPMLLARYAKRSGCTVRLVDTETKLKEESVQPAQSAELYDTTQKIEPIKYIHVDFGEDDKKDYLTKTHREKPADSVIDLDKYKKAENFPTDMHKDIITEDNSEDNNEPPDKYDERRLDL